MINWFIDFVLMFCLLWYVEEVWDCWEEFMKEDDYQESGLIYARDFFCFFFMYGYYGVKYWVSKMANKKFKLW